MTISAGSLTNFAEILIFSDMPFLLKDTIAMHKLINSDIGKRIEKEMIKKIGVRPLGYFQRGERHLTSNRPIKHPDDLQELIIRVPNVPSYVVAWKALGAKPTPMAFSEVFSSLQQGTIEAQENPFAMIKNAGFSEVQKYLNLTGHLITWGYPIVGEKQFQKLPDDLKAIFLQAAKEMQIYEHKLFLNNESKVQKIWNFEFSSDNNNINNNNNNNRHSNNNNNNRHSNSNRNSNNNNNKNNNKKNNKEIILPFF